MESVMQPGHYDFIESRPHTLCAVIGRGLHTHKITSCGNNKNNTITCCQNNHKEDHFCFRGLHLCICVALSCYLASDYSFLYFYTSLTVYNLWLFSMYNFFGVRVVEEFVYCNTDCISVFFCLGYHRSHWTYSISIKDTKPCACSHTEYKHFVQTPVLSSFPLQSFLTLSLVQNQSALKSAYWLHCPLFYHICPGTK